ncbi:hypothetical protein C8F04DRAFT_1402185 [Mycena alexandri]|uniref:F-box domain-containing protein n=1 Tax=Mycena alexandri TaxID=1745969 RepID=A0AAD6WVI8_9AGAR|nr:hypothetical protein C8F04DRAFT_1402185 [Mycena alexandri]
MHPCLLVDEIFCHIADSAKRGRKGDVYRLALTCKAFTESALDILWREIDTLMNLMFLLPPDLWYGDDVLGQPEISCMTRETIASDWTRFLVHARRVKEFTYDSDSELFDTVLRPPWNNTFDEHTVLCHLHEQCPEPYMLPTLSILSWNNNVKSIHMFICPTLRNLCLHSSTAYPGVVELLEANAPIVTSLKLNGRRAPSAMETDATLIDALSLAIVRMDRLTSFDCNLRIRPSALLHLSRLPMLHRLLFPFDSADYNAFISAVSTPFFPGLTELLILPSESTLLCSLLKGVSSTQLEWVCWEITDTHPHSILDVAAILATHPSRHALKRVFISAQWDVVLGGLPPGLITLHTFEALLALTNLNYLDLRLSWLSIGNEDVGEIARSLPRLTDLNLGASNGIILPPRITLRALLLLFQHCPLQSLGIVVDASHNVPEEEFNLPLTRTDTLIHNGRQLRRLDFGNSRIGPTKIAPITTFLSGLVPRLTTLTAWRRYVADIFPDPVPRPSSSPAMWKQVADMYEQLTLHEQPAASDSWQGFNVVRREQHSE